jgi:hypothetical protein
MQYTDLLLQHLDDTQRMFETPEHLKTYDCNMHAIQHLDLLMKYLDEILETYV